MTLRSSMQAILLERRTIQFDKTVVRQASEELWTEMVRKLKRFSSTFPENSPIGNAQTAEPLAATTITLPNVQGKAVKLKLLLAMNNGTRPGAGGFFHAPDRVTVFVDSDLSPAYMEHKETEVRAALTSKLFHEVAHALDVISTKYTSAETNRSDYFNQPSEFKAYAVQIVTDSILKFRVLRRTKWRSKAPAVRDQVEQALQASQSYQDYGKNFDAKNQNRLRQMLTRELQDAGLI